MKLKKILRLIDLPSEVTLIYVLKITNQNIYSLNKNEICIIHLSIDKEKKEYSIITLMNNSSYAYKKYKKIECTFSDVTFFNASWEILWSNED